ncbi:MAG: AmmeMemoRadiSam system protein B, partial [Planctomycetes bacterium RBG_16_59_8]
MIREPAVAGMFYPASRSALESELKRLTPAASDRRGVLGVVAPHAGYAYSGSVAGALYGAIDVPDEVVILCPNHTGRGAPFSLWPEGEWTTPLGNVPVSERLNEAIESSFDAVER